MKGDGVERAAPRQTTDIRSSRNESCSMIISMLVPQEGDAHSDKDLTEEGRSRQKAISKAANYVKRRMFADTVNEDTRKADLMS